tara:strand:+ start:1328 stop:1843 length:516 start_codon:yes stop_codon:yes gene_type:complete
MAAVLTNTGITFSDSTTQSTAALPLTGGTMTGDLSLYRLRANSGVGILQYFHSFTGTTSATSVNLLYNTGSYDDIHFQINVIGYHSGRSYQRWEGVWGGYGLSTSAAQGGGIFSLSCTPTQGSGGGVGNLAAGYNYLQLSYGAQAYAPGTYVWLTMYKAFSCAAVVGTLYT